MIVPGKYFLAGLVLFAASHALAPLHAAENLPRPADAALASPLVEGTLPNGVRYTLLPHRRELGAASVRLVVHAGSLDERDDERGFAHFVEHMAFRGTRHHPPGRLRDFFQELGLADGADLNASTAFSHTTYKIDLPAGRAARLGEVLAVMRDFADGLDFDPAEVRHERGVVLSELAARANDAGHVTQQQFAALFAGTRLPDRLPIGVTATLESADAAALRAFHRRCYAPARMSVVIVGDIDPAEAKKLLAAHFDSLRPDSSAVAASPFAPPPAADAPRAHFVSSATILGAEVTLVSLAPQTPGAADHQDQESLAIGLLNRRLTAQRNLDPTRFAHSNLFQHSSGVLHASSAGVSLSSGADDWEAALRVLEAELRRARERGFNAAEVTEQVATQLAWARAAVDTFATDHAAAVANAIADALGDGNRWRHPVVALAGLEGRAAKLTAEVARDSVRRLFDPARLHISLSRPTVPAGGEAAILAAYHTQAARALEPEPPPAPPLEFRYHPTATPGTIVQRRTEADLGLELVAFANGARLNLRASPLEPRRFRLVARLGHGFADAPHDRPGLPHLAAHFLAEGDLGRHTRDEIRRLLGLHAITLHATYDRSYLIETEGPTAELPFALQLIAAELSDPKLDPLRLMQGLSGYASCTLNYGADASGRARLAALAQIFNGDPRLSAPTQAEIERYSFSDLAGWIRSHWIGGPIEIGIVGDFDPAATISAAAGSVGALPPRPAPTTNDRPTFRAEPSRAIHRETLADETAAVTVTWPVGTGLALRPRLALKLACKILEDRLHRTLRQELGVTYTPACDLGGLGARLDTLLATAEFTFPPDRTAALTDRALALAGELARGGATAEEFSRLREPLRADLAERRRDNDAWLDDVVGIAQSAPAALEYFRAAPAALDALTLDEVNRAAAEFLAPSRASTTTIIPVPPAAVGTDAEPVSAADFTRRGEAKLTRGDLDGATADFERAIAVEPGNAIGFVARGSTRQMRGDLDGAMADATHAIGLDSKNSIAYSNRAASKLFLGAPDGAIADATKAIELEPKNSVAHATRAGARIARGEFDGAIADCDQALALMPNNEIAYQNRGIARANKGDLDGAIVDTTKAIEANPRNADTFHNRGVFRQSKGDLDGALPDLNRAIELNPAVRNAHRNRGLIHLAKGRHAAALADFDRALELWPDDNVARLNRGIARQHLRDLDGAIADNDHLLRANAQNLDALNNRGYARHLKGDHDGAIADFTRAIELKPDFALAFLNRSEAKKAKGDRMGAFEDKDRSLQLQSPLAARPAAPRAVPQAKPETIALMRSATKRDLAGARADLDKAIADDPDYPDAYVMRASLRTAQNDLAGALADTDKAIALHPSPAGALIERAIIRRIQRDYPAALTDLNRAITLSPKLSGAYFNRGLVHEARRDWRAAIADYDQAITLSPNLPPAFNGRGYARQQQGDDAKAITDFTEALRISESYTAPRFNRGVSLRAAGDLAGALADFDRLLTQSPNYLDAHANRACVRAALGDFAAAAADYDEAARRTRQADSFSHLYRWLNQRRLDPGAAPAEFARIIGGFPDGWQKTIGRLLLGEIDEAALFAAAQENAGNPTRSRECEAAYFAGMARLLAGDAADARPLFERAVAAQQPRLFAHTLARAELARLTN